MDELPGKYSIWKDIRAAEKGDDTLGLQNVRSDVPGLADDEGTDRHRARGRRGESESLFRASRDELPSRNERRGRDVRPDAERYGRSREAVERPRGKREVKAKVVQANRVEKEVYIPNSISVGRLAVMFGAKLCEVVRSLGRRR